jgi:hypothetical protein
MNHERFDELAKGLATKSFSRRQVLKSFVVGTLLATPLSALWNRQAAAQTAGCVDTSCVESAQQAHALCIGESKPGLGKGRCKKPKKQCQQCEDTFGTQLFDCGCLTINSSTATGESTYAPCEAPCAPQTLYEQANQDGTYSRLADYLTDDGFVADGSPKPIVYQEDGNLVRSQLSSSYSHPTRTNELATLYYHVEATGETLAFAAVWDSQEQTLLYLLISDGTGLVQKVDPSTTPQQTDMPSTGSITAAAKACESGELSSCLQNAALALALCLLKDCVIPAGPKVIPPCIPPNNPLCAFCVAKCAAVAAILAGVCSLNHGCGASTLFCSNNVCCGITEEGCGGNTCCTSDKTCCDGSCVTLRPDDTDNCGGCGRVCPEGFSCTDRQCTCPLEFPEQVCRRADGKFVCLAEPCDPPFALDENCVCSCPSGTSAFSIQGSAPAAVGAISVQAALTAVVCCDEGLEPCGDSGECCAPGKCNSSTGRCTCPEGKVPCGNSGACCERCDFCVDGSCRPRFCDIRKILNPDTCECECPSCTPPKRIIHLDSCTCGCPNFCIAPKVRKIPDDNCECVCPSGRTPCANTCCREGETCCDSGQCVPAGRECPVCQGGTCNNWPRGCNDNNNLFCFCMQTVEGVGVCFDERADQNCKDMQRCNTSLDCPTGQPCAVNTCCREPNNGPLFNVCIKPEQQCALTTAAAPTAKAATVEGRQPGSGPTASQPA